GSATANELRTFLEQNQVDLGGLINNLVTTGEVVVKHLPGVRQILVLYPYEVAAGYTVSAKSGNVYNARFGLIMNQSPPVCDQGYDPKQWRSPLDRGDKPMDMNAHCAEPASQSNARGAQNAPRVGADYRSSRQPVATYDLTTGKTTWADQGSESNAADGGGPAQQSWEDSWSSLLLKPAM
ncbi:MAG TPA: MCE family protein, partial [Marmoricola sp.]|nr:MCE family protein [Marmoricola sp.]